MAERASLRRMREFGRYGLASVFGLGTDMALLALLLTVLHMHYLIAATISFICGGAVVYAFSVRWVFDRRRIASRAMEFSSFIALGAVGLLVNAAVMHVAIGVLTLNFLLGKILAAGFTFCTNFLLRQHVLFSSAVPAPRRTGAQASAK